MITYRPCRKTLLPEIALTDDHSTKFEFVNHGTAKRRSVSDCLPCKLAVGDDGACVAFPNILARICLLHCLVVNVIATRIALCLDRDLISVNPDDQIHAMIPRVPRLFNLIAEQPKHFGKEMLKVVPLKAFPVACGKLSTTAIQRFTAKSLFQPFAALLALASNLSLRVPRLACPTVFPALLGKPGTDRRLVVAPNR
ncbi:MAG: hypothetical protein ABSG68_06185 [Thermoguttaceae bacterium]